jgi:MATE family multidrug resistance protein
MLCLEWWTFEILTIRAGIMGVTQLAAQNVLALTVGIAFYLPFGVAIGCSTLVGNFLGAGQPHNAKKTVRWAMFLAVSFDLVPCVLTLALGDKIGRMFTDDPDVIRNVTYVLPVVSGYFFLDALQTTGQAVLRGAGKQKIGAFVMIVSCYAVTVPLAFVMASRAGLFGMWIGVNIGYSMMVLGFLLFVVRLDWFAISVGVRKRFGELEEVEVLPREGMQFEDEANVDLFDDYYEEEDVDELDDVADETGGHMIV